MSKPNMVSYFDFKYIKTTDEGALVFARVTKEVNIKLLYWPKDKIIELSAKGDCGHHLIEDLGIFCNKLREYYGV